LATVNRGVQIYTDVAYFKTSGYVDLLQYDVRGKHSSSEYVVGDYSDPDWISVYGEENYKLNAENINAKHVQVLKEIPKEFSISNYPNPFNPTTTINYQLPEAGFVTIKVYDILGKEVSVLVNETKQAGYYNVNFDAGSLTSGIYIYSIQSNNFAQSKKMLLIR